MRSELFGRNLEATSGDAFALQNSRMLRVALDGEVMARQGSMVAFQGEVDFEYQGAGGIGRMLKKAVTGEGVPLMRCRGKGDVFFANYAAEIHLLRLEGDALSVNGFSILAFEPTLHWDIRRIEGASMFAGGLYNTVLEGTGWAAITSHGTPVVLQTDAPTYVDAQAAITWSASLKTSIHSTVKAGALVGRGSGEAVQLGFDGSGFVVVQASEGQGVAPHKHSGGGGGGGLDLDF
ncbi:MAG TPA: AIM24 family protein [Actinomycetota bacterium]|nr:AIM24 family protein [Actinomycetota bacterium]